MSDNSRIEWCDATWNCVRGCALVSKGCQHCYAMRVAHRFSRPGKPFAGLTKATSHGPVWTGAVTTHPELLDLPYRWAKPRRIFVNSMSDLFHEDVPFEFIAKVFWIMSVTSRHTYQVLTKRPARMLEFFDWAAADGPFPDARISEHGHQIGVDWTPHHEGSKRGGYDTCGPGWPYPNVWLGVSVEDQEAADERIPLLLKAPAAVRWISAEPLLGPVDVRRLMVRERGFDDRPMTVRQDALAGTIFDIGNFKRLDWVVVGGESGPGARPFDVEWARLLVKQCRDAGVPVFVKQLGADVHTHGMEGPGTRWPAGRRFEDTGDGHWRAILRDPKGGDMAEWPEDLRVREYPR